MGIFDRFLSLWVALAIALGIFLGVQAPSIFIEFSKLVIAGINIPIACLVWAMILPMMVKIDFSSLGNVFKKPNGLILTLVINWLVKPFTMAALAWLFFKVFFIDWVSPETANEYIAGMILLGTAPCTAMVFVWSNMTQGNANYTLAQVSINDIIMIFAFAPICAYLLDIANIEIPWLVLVNAITLYILLPLIVGIMIRQRLLKTKGAYEKFCKNIKPFSMLGLILTVIMLFGLQARTMIANPIAIFLISIPLIIQSYSIFMVTYMLARSLKLPFDIAAPASLIGTSNFFELAVAIAISLFGLQSGAALATIVGVLVEVPVMLSLVYFANHTQHWFQYKAQARKVAKAIQGK